MNDSKEIPKINEKSTSVYFGYSGFAEVCGSYGSYGSFLNTFEIDSNYLNSSRN